MIRYLERVVPAAPGRPEIGGPDHPMRKVTRQVAFDPGGWTAERAAKVTALFDGLAAEWSPTADESRLVPLADAVARGGPLPAGRWLEVGSGNGRMSGWLARRCRLLVATDIAGAMLAAAPAQPAPRVRADAARLPFPDGAIDVAVLVNALLFPAELARVTAAGGAIVWVNTNGDATPIYLPAEDVNAAMGEAWDAVAAEAGWGTWAVLRRR